MLRLFYFYFIQLVKDNELKRSISRPPIFHERILEKVHFYYVNDRKSRHIEAEIQRVCRSRINLFFVILAQRKESAMAKPINILI